MRRLFSLCLLLGLGACSLFEPSGQRYAVYFQESSAQTVNSAEGVVVDAANWAKRHPDMPVIVASYTDPYGSQKANADFTRLRAQVVSDGLVANGVLASRIERREIGSVKFQSDSQESRRVEIIIGHPSQLYLR
jgi:outer membrane protein OmpA-like peptidoglycan-associated protein